MEQKHGSVSDGLPPLCATYPWIVSHSPEAEEDSHTFYTIQNPLVSYRCRIPELLGKRIRGFFHGWVILSNSNNVMWSLWNPETSKVIRFPPLILKDGGDIDNIMECCLSSPPDDPNSILLLTRSNKPTFILFRLDSIRKRYRWTEMSYDKQLKRISRDGDIVHGLACCDGRVFALNTDGPIAMFVIHVDIVVKDREVVIKLSVFGSCPCNPRYLDKFRYYNLYLKGSSAELFFIEVGLDDETKTLSAVTLYKLNMTSINWEKLEGLKDWNMTNKRDEELVYEDMMAMGLEITSEMWEEMSDLEDSMFFVDLRHDYSVFYRSGIASELGGYIHIRGETGKIIHSYLLKDKTISISNVPAPVLHSNHLLLWEYRLDGDYADCNQEYKDNKAVIGSVTNDEVEFSESHLLNLPFHLLEMIMKLCEGVEYLSFRSTCKRCHLATPMIQWRDEESLSNYSVVSPWLMEVHEEWGPITFIDPMLGDKY